MNINGWEIALRLLLALALGGVIGMQRELVRSSAGFRTHTLVCLGSCLAMLTNIFLLQRYSGAGNMDVARLGSYVLGGIGFLGAGTIVKEGLHVRGLTTAAGLWMVAAIGLAVGAGFYLGALVVGVTTVATLAVLKVIEDKSFGRKGLLWLEMELYNTPGALAEVLQPLADLGCLVCNVRMERAEDEWMEAMLQIKLPRGLDRRAVIERLRSVKDIKI